MSTLHRNRKGELFYRDYLKKHVHNKKACLFCAFTKDSEQVLKEHRFFFVVTNTFPYTLWDSCTVTEHLMIVPKRHVRSLSSFTKEEILQYHRIAASYEKQGYDVFARGMSSTMKSIAHQHTHLIKTDGQKIKGLIYVEKPLIHKVML